MEPTCRPLDCQFVVVPAAKTAVNCGVEVTIEFGFVVAGFVVGGESVGVLGAVVDVVMEFVLLVAAGDGLVDVGAARFRVDLQSLLSIVLIAVMIGVVLLLLHTWQDQCHVNDAFQLLLMVHFLCGI